jgi:HEAT repeat protein
MRRWAAGLVLILLTVGLAACKKGPTPPDLGALVNALRDPAPEVRGKAVLELIRIGDPAVIPVAALLEDPDPRIRGVAASTLWSLGPRARQVLPQITHAMADESAEVRLGAAMACEAIGADAAPAVPALIKLLGDSDGTVKLGAANALGAVGPGAGAAVPALIQASKNSYMHDAAEQAILRIRTGG